MRKYIERGKSFLDKSKCLLGFHQGSWEYRQSADCAQFMVCERCGTESRRVEHRWSEWDYKADGSCDQVRTCGRCEQSESQLKHVWGEPRYKYTDVCEQAAVCSRCGDQEDRAAAHRFDGWLYQNQDDCKQIEACSRCGQFGRAARVQHDWHDWTSSAFYQSRVRVCRHCGEMLVDAPGTPVSMQAIESAVDRVAASGSWDEMRRHLHADEATLLSPVTEKYFKLALERYPKDASVQQPLADVQRIVTRCREVGIDPAIGDFGGVAVAEPTPPAQVPQTQSVASSTAAPTPAAAGRLDHRLIGHWRSIESMPGRGFSMVIDSHCVLDANGDFSFWSKSRNSLHGSDSEREPGTWEAYDGELRLRFRSGTNWSKAYIVGAHMLWPKDRRYGVWERIG